MCRTWMPRLRNNLINACHVFVVSAEKKRQLSIGCQTYPISLVINLCCKLSLSVKFTLKFIFALINVGSIFRCCSKQFTPCFSIVQATYEHASGALNSSDAQITTPTSTSSRSSVTPKLLLDASITSHRQHGLYRRWTSKPTLREV